MQYFLNIFTSIIKQEIINRNVNEKIIIDISNNIDNYTLYDIISKFNCVCKYIKELYKKTNSSFWNNKACFFTICYSLYNNILNIDLENINDRLIDNIALRLDKFYKNQTEDWKTFYASAKQGVNDKDSRIARDKIFNKIVFNNK